MSQTSFSNWDFSNFHVQQELQGGQFVSAETSLIASGPPSLSGEDPYFGGGSAPAASVNQVYPIGLLENAGISQSKQLQKIFEIGSSRSYFIPGRVIGSVQMGRIFYYGPSLLRVLYAYYYQERGVSDVEIGTAGGSERIQLEDDSWFQSPLARLLDTGSKSFHKVKVSPGEDFLYMNLASDLFNQGFGLAFYFKDANFNSVGAFYLEQTYIQGHQFSVSSGNVLIMEGASAQYDRLLPIAIMTT